MKYIQNFSPVGRYLFIVFVLVVILALPVLSQNINAADADNEQRLNAKEQIDESRRGRILAEQAYFAQLSQEDVADKKERIERKRAWKKELSEEERGRRRRHFEQFRLLKLLELIDLSEDQEDAFIKSFRQLRREMVRERKVHRGLMRRLKKMVGKSGADESKVYDIFAGIKSSRVAEENSRAEFMDRAKAMLTASQFGRLILFQEQFDAQLLGKLGARRRAPRPGREMPPPDRFPDEDNK